MRIESSETLRREAECDELDAKEAHEAWLVTEAGQLWRRAQRYVRRSWLVTLTPADDDIPF